MYVYMCLRAIIIIKVNSFPVMFEIELINFIDHKAADSYDFMSKDERMQLTLDDLIAVANAEREVCVVYCVFTCMHYALCTMDC